MDNFRINLKFQAKSELSGEIEICVRNLNFPAKSQISNQVCFRAKVGTHFFYFPQEHTRVCDYT